MSEFDFVVPDFKKPKYKCVSCNHCSIDSEKQLWCVQPKNKKMWHTTARDRFCYFHTKWKQQDV